MQISKKEVLNLLNQFNSNILEDPIILHYKNFQDKTYTKKNVPIYKLDCLPRTQF